MSQMNSASEIKVHKKLSFSTIVGLVLLFIAILCGILLYYLREYGIIASGYAARQMCSCIYVQSRSESSCLKEMEVSGGSSIKYVKFVYFREKVVANFLGVAAAQAELSPGKGCSARGFSGAMPNGLDNVE